MKKKFFFFLLIVFLLSFVSAVEIEVKSDVNQGENLIVKISGIFAQPLTKDNLGFYRRHMQTSFGFYDMIEVDGDYYVYVQIPEDKTPDNYSIALKNAQYYSGSKIVNDEFIGGNFTIHDKKASFSLTPGLLIYEENSKITIQNLKNVKIKVYKGFAEKIKVPIIEENNETNSTEMNETNKTEEDKSIWDLLFKGKENNETTAFFEKETIVEDTREYFELKSGEIKELEIVPENYVGFQKIWFNYEEENYYVYIYVRENYVNEIIENKTELNETNASDVNITIIEIENKTEDEEIKIKTCEERNASICNSTSKCEGKIEQGENGNCCMGECVLKPETNTGKIIGWILIIVIALFLTWFFKEKYRKPKKTPVNLEKESRSKK